MGYVEIGFGQMKGTGDAGRDLSSRLQTRQDCLEFGPHWGAPEKPDGPVSIMLHK
ncbi:hypothetical protein SAMN04489731_12842 [Amycolatopsis regifaucium]|nr:hypothetical protein SAMN04489731_12842 [Amycolatopsis regifaucium]